MSDFLYLLQFLSKMQKTVAKPYVLFIATVAMLDNRRERAATILKVHTLRMIVSKFGSNWSSGFRRDDFLKSL